MASWALALAVLSAILCLSYGEYKRVCYYGSWASGRPDPNGLKPDEIDPTLCTHLMYAFAKLDANATHLRPLGKDDNNLMTQFTDLKSQNPDLKVLLSLGGWEMGSEPFVKLVSSQQNIDAFANNAVRYLRLRNFDGLDLDWEFPAARGSGPEDKDNFIALLHTLREAFDNDPKVTHQNLEPLMLTAAVSPTEWQTQESYNVTGLVQYLDFIILMTYDFHGEWEEVVNVHSALYSDGDLSVDRLVSFWISEGAPKNMLVVGIPLYGRSFTLANVTDQDIGAPHSGGGDMPYFEICDLIKTHSIQPVTLETERVPYFVHNDQWIGFEDENSISEKVKYIHNQNLFGAAVWALDLDDVSGACGRGKFPLMHALRDGFANVEAIVG